MHESGFGAPKAFTSRRVPVVYRDLIDGLFSPKAMELFDRILTEECEVPAGGAFSTAADLLRWAEALRRGGSPILSTETVALATRIHTGDKPNNLWEYASFKPGWGVFPANLGLGFFLRGEGDFPTPFGRRASPHTFGALGAGSTLFWVDPERDLTFVCLTSGLLEETHSIERFQRLSDLVLASSDLEE
jgi:CubicO group peptidase (beta-lactamase class C family)